MKTKKLLVLMVMFLFLITAVVVAPNVAYAEGESGTTISDEFKQILNGEGKLVVTDTSMSENKQEFLYNYVLKYNTNAYNFRLVSYDEANAKCDISMMKIADFSQETHTVDVVFQEKFSDEFNKLLKNGKFLVPTSEKLTLNVLSNYMNGLSTSNPNYIYAVAYSGSGALVSADGTKATIQMKNKSQDVLEQHIVELTYLTEKSEDFKKVLNKDGKLVFNSVEPKDMDDMYFLFEISFMNSEHAGFVMEEVADDFSSIVLTINSASTDQETHRVDVVYNYDKTVRAKLNNFVNNFPKTNNREYYFYIRDLELVNYLINNVQSEDTENLDAFSGELKSLVDNNNIDYYVDNRAGAEELFIRERIGIATFKYDGIIYYLDPALGTKAEFIMYVPDTTTNSKEDIMTAAQKRINEYLNNDNIAKLSYAGTVDDVWCNIMYEATRYEWEPQSPNMTLEEWKGAFYPAYDEYDKEVVKIDGIEKTDFVYNLTVKVGDKQKVFQIIIKKDSSKMITPTYKTADLLTNVAISSEAGIIPLDANIKANKITSGDEYQKIIKLLDVQENAMYDLKLYSSSLKDYVTKLDDGTFEVKIPVPDNLKGKELVAYYTTGTGEPEKYAVEVKNGYAIFKTNHFSIYTLAESKVTPSGEDEENKGNTGKTEESGSTGEETGNSDNGTENTNGENENTENSNNENKDTKNPKTGDSVAFFVVTLLVAVAGIVTVVKFRK